MRRAADEDEDAVQSVQIYTQCVILQMVKHCVTSHQCVCDFTHSFWFCKFMLFFREEISVTIYARFCVKFSHIKLCWCTT